MAKILITSGPTRQYLDPVRYMTNASSGRMGAALAEAALAMGHAVTVVSGPVSIHYPTTAQVHFVDTTEEMLQITEALFATHDGLIGAAAPCDYMPRQIQTSKIAKSGEPLLLELIETSDVVATVAKQKRLGQWVVGFMLETEDQRFRAIVKMQRKCCDLMVSNGPSAINSEFNEVEILAPEGQTVSRCAGNKREVAAAILMAIETHLILKQPVVRGCTA